MHIRTYVANSETTRKIETTIFSVKHQNYFNRSVMSYQKCACFSAIEISFNLL